MGLRPQPGIDTSECREGKEWPLRVVGGDKAAAPAA
jgi:hypothetical protein